MFIVLKGDVVKIEHSLQRKQHQGDQGDMRRKTAITELVRTLEDTDAEVTRDCAKADAAIAA